MDIQKEKEAFEKYCFEVFLMSPSDGHFDRELEDPETYESLDTHRLWALWQAKTPAVPDGFVLVPKKPSETIISAMKISRRQFSTYAAESMYEAIIKAQEQGQ